MVHTKNKSQIDADIRSGVPIPGAYSHPFHNGIVHPDLWLWDSWCLVDEKAWHLYCLALSRTDKGGQDIPPMDRNLHQFHIRHFISQDSGITWTDRGAYFKPETTPDGYFDSNIWSGSVLKLDEDRYLTAFTAIRKVDADHPFLQSIGLATSSNNETIENVQATPLSCPLRDYEYITSMGYYLGPKASLGHKGGEDGGPIMAWRDPYLYQDKDGGLHLFWSAKVSPTEGVMAHATLTETSSGFAIDRLHPPARFPDSEKFTQAEVPKIYRDTMSGKYYCLLAACDRLYEGQPDYEVTKVTRLYRSRNLDGPWQAHSETSSKLERLDNLFGCSIISEDFAKGKLALIAPVTEMADSQIQLTFADIQKIEI